MKVSLVMAVYNGEEFLKEALDSALSQTYTNLEVIVVNDGSTDSTKTILDAIDDRKIKVIHLEQNQGAANALNIGIRQAKGDWIAIQDADDNSLPARIEEQVKYIIKHPQLVGVGSFIKCIPGSPNISDGWLKGIENNRNSFVSRNQIRKKIYYGCPLTHSSMMFSKDVFWEVGGYSTDLKIAYDYDLWLKLIEKGDMENVPKVLVQYRIRHNSLSHNNGPATINEIQVASSRAVYRFFRRDKDYLPKVIVTGPQKGCENYRDHIAPICGLEVTSLIYEDWNNQVSAAVNQLKKGKVDAIIVLDRYEEERILNYFKKKGLVLNKQVFNLYYHSEIKQRFYYREKLKGRSIETKQRFYYREILKRVEEY